MLARNYHYLGRNNPEQRSSQLLRGGTLKSCKNLASWTCEYGSSKVREMQVETM